MQKFSPANLSLFTVFEVQFYTRKSCVAICKNGRTSFIEERAEFQKEETNELDPYAVVTVERTDGCTKNQGSWPWANQQHIVYFFSKVEISNVQ